MAPFLIALLIIGGGTSLAAKTAVPGNLLYGMKTGFNENLQKSLSFSDASKAHWDAVLEQRRLDEASKLQASGKLTAADQAKLKANFDAEAKDYSERMAKIQSGSNAAQATEAASINTDLNAALSSRQSSMLSLGVTGDENIFSSSSNNSSGSNSDMNGSVNANGNSNGDGTNVSGGLNLNLNGSGSSTSTSSGSATSTTSSSGGLKIGL